MPTDDSSARLPEHVKREVIALLQQYMANDLSFDATIYQARKLSRLHWYRQMLDDLRTDYDPDLPRLPNAPGDALYLRSPLSTHKAMQRLIRFIQSDRTYNDGEPAWVCWLNRVVIVVFVSCIVALMATLFVQHQLGQDDTLQAVANGLGIVALICFVPIAVIHTLSLTQAGVHIFRVRVLRQDLRCELEQDIWPYVDRTDYEADQTRIVEPSKDLE